MSKITNYRELVSKFASTGACGHAIAKGDVIGWHRRDGALCKDCWRQWRAENAAAEQDERFYAGQYGHY